jgi:hypothetical protein
MKCCLAFYKSESWIGGTTIQCVPKPAAFSHGHLGEQNIRKAESKPTKGNAC